MRTILRIIPHVPIGKKSLTTYFGSLELRVLEALWGRNEETSVRDVLGDFPGIAYTTLMTTLDRLHKKGILSRRRSGRAFLYTPISSRANLEASLAAETLDTIVASFSTPAAIRPLLTSFVEAVSRRDALALDELEKALRARRRALRQDEGER